MPTTASEPAHRQPSTMERASPPGAARDTGKACDGTVIEPTTAEERALEAAAAAGGYGFARCALNADVPVDPVARVLKLT